MKKLLQQKEMYGPEVMIDRTLKKRESKKEFPEPLMWAINVSYWNGNDWVPICRADNYLHKHQAGSHIHTFNPDTVKRIDITYEKADKIVKETSKRILKEKFSIVLEFE